MLQANFDCLVMMSDSSTLLLLERAPPAGHFLSFCMQNDLKMQEIIRYTHLFLQKFCTGNQENQALLHKNLNLFLNPGVPSFYV